MTSRQTRRSVRATGDNSSSPIVMGFLMAVCSAATACNDPRSARADDLGVGEPAPEVEVSLPEDEKAHAVRLGREVLATYFEEGREEALEVELEDVPDSFDDPGPRLFVTLRNQGVLRASFSGTGETFAEIIKSGVVRSIEDERFGGVLEASEVPTTRLEFNAVLGRTSLDERSVDGLSQRIEPGRHAFELEADGSRAFFKETVMITHNYDHQTALTRLCEKAEVDPDCFTEADTLIDRFRAEHWVEDENESRGYYELFRGHRIIRPDDVTKRALEEAARLGADYLVAHQLDSGAFEYLYEPHQDALVDDDNTVRQAGASYSASKLATYFGTDQYVTMARAAIDNLLSYEQTNSAGSYIRWGRASLGLTGLALLGVVELSDDSVGDDYKDAALRLARGIIGQQNDEGRLHGDFENEDADADSAQQFYPGEALLALSRTAQRWPEEESLLAALEASFDYYVEFWRERGESAFVPWQAAAWANVYFITNESKYADFVFEMIDWSISRQNRSSYGNWAKDDYAGAYTRYTGSPPSFSTATHSEPVPLAIAVARDIGDSERAERYADAQRHAMRFVLQLVITERETFYMPDPARSVGGIRTSLNDNNVRIDNVQHADTAFIHALEYLQDEPLAWGE